MGRVNPARDSGAWHICGGTRGRIAAKPRCLLPCVCSSMAHRLNLPHTQAEQVHLGCPKPRLNRYTSVAQEAHDAKSRHAGGTIISIPLFSKPARDIDQSMRMHIWMPAAILTLTLLVAFIIVVGGCLPPGFVDPDTHVVRFVSDGFKDYRALPWTCLPLLLGMVGLFCRFAFIACYNTKEGPRDYGWVWMTGAISVVGFILVAALPEGNVHLSGAAIFITFYAAMQLALDMILWRVHRGTWWSRMMEYGILSITAISALIFGILIIISSAMGGDPTLNSGSAVAEYMVFVCFIALNMYGASLMTYIINWYKLKQDSKGGWWVPIEDEEEVEPLAAP